MKIDKAVIKNLLGAVKMTHPDEIGCNGCFDEIHKFAEMEVLGKSPEKAMPLVQDHLNKCGECREEYQALLSAIKKLK
ncbi:MAG: hypothetical protein WD059_13035 [Balneolaceae bacterium]